MKSRGTLRQQPYQRHQLWATQTGDGWRNWKNHPFAPLASFEWIVWRHSASYSHLLQVHACFSRPAWFHLPANKLYLSNKKRDLFASLKQLKDQGFEFLGRQHRLFFFISLLDPWRGFFKKRKTMKSFVNLLKRALPNGSKVELNIKQPNGDCFYECVCDSFPKYSVHRLRQIVSLSVTDETYVLYRHLCEAGVEVRREER